MNSDGIKSQRGFTEELDNVNFKALKIAQLDSKKVEIITVVNKEKPKKHKLKNNKISPRMSKVRIIEPKTQLASFQKAMRMLIVLGNSLGLNPVQGILEPNIANMRFTIFSWRFLHSILIGIAQAIVVVLCLYRLVTKSISIGPLSFVTFYTSTCATTFLFLHIGYRWAKLMKDVSKCNLDEYVDNQTKKTCYLLTVANLTLGLIEHILSLLHKVEHIVSCHPDANMFDKYLSEQFPWYFDLNLPKNVPIGIFLQILLLTTTLNWNYPDLYIVCISIYLSGILKKINAKIIAASEKHDLPSSHWRTLREDYTRATTLVRSFDDALSGLVFTSFASNLFFICLQVFKILVHGLDYQHAKNTCTAQSRGLLGGYEYAVYLIFSTTLLLVRTLTVSLVAASVNTASMVPAPALYKVPSSAFCDEVSRFITQVNEDKVALSGLHFFYVTRDLVLTVAGTIVTYELVLLQFNTS